MSSPAVIDARNKGYRYKVRATRARPMRLTPRDIRLLLAVHKYRVLHRGQVARLVFAQVDDQGSSARKRLNLLYQHGYLERIPRFAVPPHTNPGPAYRLAQRGAVVLARRANIRWPEFNYWGKGDDRDSHVRHLGHAYLEHNLVLADIRLWFEAQAGRAGCEIAVWKDYLDLRATWKTQRVVIHTSRYTCEDVPVTPDGYFVLQTQQGRGHFFLEFDRGSESVANHWKRKIRTYEEYLRSGKFHQHYQVDPEVGFRVVTITAAVKRAANLHQAVGTYAAADNARLFLFAAWPQLQLAGLTDQLWWRGGSGAKQVSLLPS